MKFKIFDVTFLKFVIVGGLGMGLNLVLFFLLADIIKLDPNLSAILTFIVCVTHNYLLNHIWSFKKLVNSPPDLKRYFKFFLIYCCGLIVNLIVLNIILNVYHPELKVIADFFAAISSILINFLGAKFFVFSRGSSEDTQNIG